MDKCCFFLVKDQRIRETLINLVNAWLRAGSDSLEKNVVKGWNQNVALIPNEMKKIQIQKYKQSSFIEYPI
jgi:hypothetical protein